MIERIQALKAQVMMRVAGFIFKKHTNPFLIALAKFATWLNRKRFGNDALDFLEDEDSIDIMTDADYEAVE